MIQNVINAFTAERHVVFEIQLDGLAIYVVIFQLVHHALTHYGSIPPDLRGGYLQSASFVLEGSPPPGGEGTK